METTPNGWTVIDRDAAVLTSSYIFDGKAATANTFVARMADGRLLVVSPTVGSSDALHADLAEFGEVGAIVANNGFHHLGQAEWKARYPKARYFAPPDAVTRIAKKSTTAGEFEPLEKLAPLLGDNVGLRDVPNTKCGESWVWAKIEGGYAWYVSDVLANMTSLPGNFLIRQMFKWTKSGPGYSVFGLAMKFIVKDKKATLKLLSQDMAAHPPTVVVPAHGPTLTQAGIADETQSILQAAMA